MEAVQAEPGLRDAGAGNQQITAQMFSSKYRSKKEVYLFMVNRVGAYLPPIHSVTIYHLRDLMSGAKKVSPQSLQGPTPPNLALTLFLAPQGREGEAHPRPSL